jgi:hypothetical protein
VVAIHGAVVQRDWPRETATCTAVNIACPRRFVAPTDAWSTALLAFAAFLGYSGQNALGGQVMDAKTVFIVGLGTAILLLVGFCATPL